MKTGTRLKRRGNTIKVTENYSIIYTAKGEEIYCDNESIELLSQYTWQIDKEYVVARDSTIMISMHRLLFNFPKDKKIDHINGNPRDNRLNNLRVCTNQQNCMNRKKQNNNTSGRTGVDIRYNKYIARIKVNQKNIQLGTFETFEEACKAREEAEKIYFKEYRKIH